MLTATKTAKKRYLALISGGGSNLQSVLDGCKNGELSGEVVAVISSNAEAGGLERAQKNNIPCYVCALKDFADRESRDGRILQLATEHRADYILLLGYLGICTPLLVGGFKNRIINIHPALLPKFGGKGFFGLNVHKAVIEAGESVSGATVHFVDAGTDTGEIILQKDCPVLPTDSPEDLQKRVLTVEHKLIIEALKLLEKHN